MTHTSPPNLMALGRPIEGTAKPIPRTPETECLFDWEPSEEAKRDMAEIQSRGRFYF